MTVQSVHFLLLEGADPPYSLVSRRTTQYKTCLSIFLDILQSYNLHGSEDEPGGQKDSRQPRPPSPHRRVEQSPGSRAGYPILRQLAKSLGEPGQPISSRESDQPIRRREESPPTDPMDLLKAMLAKNKDHTSHAKKEDPEISAQVSARRSVNAGADGASGQLSSGRGVHEQTGQPEVKLGVGGQALSVDSEGWPRTGRPRVDGRMESPRTRLHGRIAHRGHARPADPGRTHF
jgi:hypothetical protein